MKYAVFADIENVNTSYAGFIGALNKIAAKGDIATCKFYGYKPLKHAAYTRFINNYGYEAVSYLHVKGKRNKTDMRIVIDAIEYAIDNPSVEGIVIMMKGYIVPLISGLRALGKSVICAVTEDLDNLSSMSEVLLLPTVKKAAPSPMSRPVQDKASDVTDYALVSEVTDLLDDTDSGDELDDILNRK